MLTLSILQDCATVQLSRGLTSLIDADDVAWLSRWKWHANGRRGGIYAKRNGKRGEPNILMMHRELLSAPPDMDVDHANHDTLDNRRSNIRLATEAQNGANRLKMRRPTSSRFKGVTECSNGAWLALITKDGRTMTLGYFDDEVDAAYAYDRAARTLHGEFAATNFDTDDPSLGIRGTRKRRRFTTIRRPDRALIKSIQSLRF